MDVWWNPATEQQAIDRTHRIGQRKSVFVHQITVANTVEDRILELQKQVISLKCIFLQTFRNKKSWMLL